MADEYIDLRQIALKYHVDIFGLMLKAGSRKVQIIDGYLIQNSDLEKLTLYEEITNEKGKITYKKEDANRRLNDVVNEITQCKKEIAEQGKSGQAQLIEKLSELESMKKRIERELSGLSIYTNGSRK